VKGEELKSEVRGKPVLCLFAQSTLRLTAPDIEIYHYPTLSFIKILQKLLLL
jgi:hypothetical protein